MLKVWDKKLVALRAELNIHQLNKRIEEKADEDEVRNDLNGQSQRIVALESSMGTMINEFDALLRDQRTLC